MPLFGGRPRRYSSPATKAQRSVPCWAPDRFEPGEFGIIEGAEVKPADFLGNLLTCWAGRTSWAKPRDWNEGLVADCHKKGSGRSYPSVYGRMSWDEPAPTMTTQFYGFGNGRFGHPEQDRAISLREGAILQSFPKGYKFTAPRESIYIILFARGTYEEPATIRPDPYTA